MDKKEFAKRTGLGKYFTKKLVKENPQVRDLSWEEVVNLFNPNRLVQDSGKSVQIYNPDNSSGDIETISGASAPSEISQGYSVGAAAVDSPEAENETEQYRNIQSSNVSKRKRPSRLAAALMATGAAILSIIPISKSYDSAMNVVDAISKYKMEQEVASQMASMFSGLIDKNYTPKYMVHVDQNKAPYTLDEIQGRTPVQGR